MPEPKSETSRSDSGLGFKFNATGRDDATTDIIKPKLDGAAKRRNMVAALVIVALIIGLGIMSFGRSGLNFADIFNPPDQQAPAFGVPGNRDPAKSE